MSRSDKKRRKAFLNDLCAKFGIDNPSDPRRSDAAIAFIAYGEEECREKLERAAGNYANWETIVDVKRARRIVSIHHNQKKKIRRTQPRSTNRQRRYRRSRDSQCKARDYNICGTVRPDGSGSGWRNLSRNQEYGLANRI